MKKIYIMRHGQTEYNEQRKVQGWCNSPLTELGIFQAKVARDYFKNKKIVFDAAYSSSLGRACETIEIVLDGKLSYTKVDGLKERNFGTLEESSDYNLEKEHFPFGDWMVEYGAETEAAFRDRICRTITDIAKKDGDNILILTHGGTCAEFAINWDENNFYHFNEVAGNCAIYVYEYENEKFSLRDVVEHGI